jgi:hypothetical protein
MSTEADVLAANEAFYAAFRLRDADAMDRLWSRHTKVACIHPGWDALVGREAVVASFRAILGGDPPALRCGGATVHVIGEAAFVVCTERIAPDGPRLVATNVFVLEDGTWRLAHHQAAPIARPSQKPEADREEPPDGTGGMIN